MIFMSKKLKHRQHASVRDDEVEVAGGSPGGRASSVSSSVGHGISAGDIIGLVAVSSEILRMDRGLVLSSDVADLGLCSNTDAALVEGVSSLVCGVLVEVAPKVISYRGVPLDNSFDHFFQTDFSVWGTRHDVALASPPKVLVGGVTLGNVSHVPYLNVFLESSLPALKRGWLADSLPKVESLVGEVFLRPRVAPQLEGAPHSLPLSTEVERELRLGLDVFACLSGSEVELGLLEEVLGINEDERDRNEGGVPRSLSAVGNGVIVFVVVERKESEWHLLVAHLVKVLLEEFIGSGVKVFVREAAEEGEEVESIDGLEKEPLGRLNLRGVVEVFDLRRDPYSSNHVLELVKSRLPVLYTHGPGALIVALSREGVGRKLYESIKKVSSCPTYFLNLARREGRRLEDLASLLILGSPSKDVGPIGKSPYHVIRRRTKALKKTVDKLSYFVRRQVSDGKHVDVVQYGLKVATFSAIIRKAVEDRLRELVREGKRVDAHTVYKAISDIKGHLEVRVEESLRSGSGGSAVVPDIVFEDEGSRVCVEVETLTGTGEPMKKIDESIEKYRGLESECSKVWIVLPPEAAFLHMKELEERLKILETLPEQGYLGSVEIKILALRSPRPSPLALRSSRPSPWRDAFGWVLIDLRRFKAKIKSLASG